MSGRVERLHVYPVKGLRGREQDSVLVEPCGLRDDRRWMITDENGVFLTQRGVPAMARIAAIPTAEGIRLVHGDVAHHVARPAARWGRSEVEVWGDRLSAARADPAAEAWIGDVLDRRCRLVFLDDERVRPVKPGFAEPGDHVSFADGYPLLAASSGSLDALNAVLDAEKRQPVPMNRFRPNLTFGGLPAWNENRWSRIRVGAVVFRGINPCTRCVVVTTDQQTGERPEPGEPLRTLGRLNRLPAGIVFGANLIPENRGRIAVGDPLDVLEWTT